MRWKVLTVLSLVVVLAALVAAPAQADYIEDVGKKAGNTLANAILGVGDFFKAAGDEIEKAPSRGYVGVVVTAPLAGVGNLVIRYVGVGVDAGLFWLPTKNFVRPAAYEKWEPIVPIPK